MVTWNTISFKPVAKIGSKKLISILNIPIDLFIYLSWSNVWSDNHVVTWATISVKKVPKIVSGKLLPLTKAYRFIDSFVLKQLAYNLYDTTPIWSREPRFLSKNTNNHFWKAWIDYKTGLSIYWFICLEANSEIMSQYQQYSSK